MKNILITGSSTGIGFASAVRFAEKGYQVWAQVRKAEDGRALTEKNKNIRVLVFDVTDEAGIEKARSLIDKEDPQGEFSLLNNAGITRQGPVEGVPLKEWREQFDVNVFGVVSMLQAFLPRIRKTKGRVVQVSSISGRISFPFLGPYCASKFALEALTDSLRHELRPHGVKVILIEPGPIETPIWQKGLGQKEAFLNSLTPENSKVYGRQLQSFIEDVEKNVEQALPVSAVVKQIEKALESRAPAARYPVGGIAKAAITAHKILPNRVFDLVVSFRDVK